MKQTSSARRAILASLLALPIVSAQAGPYGNSALFQRGDDDDGLLNRFSLSYSMGLNISAGFKNVQLVPNYISVPNHQGIATPMLVNPGSTNAVSPHVYDDGYALVDIYGNAGGYTSYYGYQNASQVHSDALVMHATTATIGAGPQGVSGDPQHGLQFTYNRQLGRSGQVRWGLEAGFGFTDVTMHDNQSVAGDYTTTTDSYSLANPLGGVIVPVQTGLYSAPTNQPVIHDAPSRTVAPVAGYDQFDLHASVFGWRLGPYAEFPVIKQRLSFFLSGGAALYYVDSHFSFQESVPRAGMASLVNSGSGSHGDFLAGGYVEGDLSLKLSRSVDLFTGVQYTKIGQAFNTQGNKQAQIDFSNSLFVTLGVSYRF
jgi:hypothetical protein